MRHEYEKARRHAENTLAEVNRHLDRGNIKNPRHYHMLADMAEKATRTLNNLDRMDDARPYSDTNIGYRTDARRRRYADDDVHDVVRMAMDAVDRILPHIADDDRYDVDDRRGVPGTGRRRVRRVRADRYDDRYDTNDRYDDDMDDDRYDDDDTKVYNMPRWRSARTGRFLPNLYGPRRVRRVRRSDMDDRYDDDRYDCDDRQYDNRYDDRTSRTDDIYPGTPVMRDDRRTRDDRTGRRCDDRTDTDNEAHRPGPDIRR